MNNDHISTSEIKHDIYETELEIITLKREIEGLRLLGDRMSIFRAAAKQSGIEERKIFIEKLRKILSAREMPTAPVGENGEKE